MTIRFARIRTAVVALCATAALATAVAGTAAAGTGHSERQRGPAAAAASQPVVIDCAMKQKVKPGGYILSCGDARAFISKVHWAAWGGQSAFGAGTYNFKPAAKTLTFPILAALWRVKPLPGDSRVRYFTRLTLIFTGNRAYKVGGKTFRQPQTSTFPLSNFGGAG